MFPRTHPILAWFYLRILMLYPRAFREEFASEMRADFADALEAAERRGFAAVLVLLVRETLGGVVGALVQRWQQAPNDPSSGNVMGRTGIGFALVPFALLVLISISNAARVLWPPWVTMTILGFIGLLILIGLVRGLPDWSLPYIGLGFGILGLFGVGYAYRALMPFYQLSSDPAWRTILDGGVMWWGFFALIPMLVTFTAFVKPWRPFYERMRGDWTVLSFALYGSLPIALVITFEEYGGDEWFIIAATGALMTGAFLYLRQPTHNRRAAALGCGIAISLGIAALGKFLLLPQQEWARSTAGQVELVARWNESFHTIAIFGWAIIAILLVPAFLDYMLARIPRPAQPRV